MGELETSTVQGELIVGTVVHSAMLNCMIVPYDNPDEWFFKQFPSTAAIEEFAAKFNLVIKAQEHGNPSS